MPLYIFHIKTKPFIRPFMARIWICTEKNAEKCVFFSNTAIGIGYLVRKVFYKMNFIFISKTTVRNSVHLFRKCDSFICNSLGLPLIDS